MTIWFACRVTTASVATPSTCTAVCPALTLPADGGARALFLALVGTVVVVARTTARVGAMVDVVVVVDNTATDAPATTMLVVVVVGATVATDI